MLHKNVKNSIIKIIIIFVIVLIILHYRKYTQYTDEYQIDQQELDYVSNFSNQLNPLVITFIENTSLYNNVTKYKLYSPLSFHHKNEIINTANLNPDNFYNVYSDGLLIRTENNANIVLVNPKYKSHFVKHIGYDITSLKKVFKLPPEKNTDVESIQVIIRDYNILYIPRHWLFKINTEDHKFELFQSHSFFSWIGSRFT
jgi:hypothetical protein